jgi:hypothetical protein
MSIPIKQRGFGFTISQLLSALDDRNVVRAVRVLEPGVEDSERSPKDQSPPRCERCITRGE